MALLNFLLVPFVINADYDARFVDGLSGISRSTTKDNERHRHGYGKLLEHHGFLAFKINEPLLAAVPSSCFRGNGLLPTGANAATEAPHRLLFQRFQVSDAACRG